GFQRFRETGTFFPHGRQDHASTETAPGHSTMLSGREPGHTGIILNNRGVQDPTSPALEVPDKQGSSPRRFQGTTLYDWLLARDPDTRVLSVSRKDRGAIFPVGRGKGNVYWWLGGQFTTSRYYSDTLPRWVSEFNSRIDLKHIAGSTWSLLLPASAYAEPDSMAFENAGSDFTFPHQLPGADVIAGRITSYPVMDSLTLALALSGVERMRLGTRGRPDLLVVSLSTTDAVGHAFGPDSREIHDQLLHVDRWLGQFFDSLSKLVPGGMVAALTGDHGIVSLPEYTVLVKHQRAGRVGMGSFPADVERELEAKYHVPFDLSFDNGLLSADVDALRARGVNVDSLADALAKRIAGNPGDPLRQRVRQTVDVHPSSAQGVHVRGQEPVVEREIERDVVLRLELPLDIRRERPHPHAAGALMLHQYRVFGKAHDPVIAGKCRHHPPRHQLAQRIEELAEPAVDVEQLVVDFTRVRPERMADGIGGRERDDEEVRTAP